MRSEAVYTAVVAFIVVLSGAGAPVVSALGGATAGSGVGDQSGTATATETLTETRTTAERDTANATDAREKVGPELRRSAIGAGSVTDSGTSVGAAATTSGASAVKHSVVVELEPERVGAGREAVARILGSDASAHGRYVEATATAEEILALAEERSVSYVRTPSRPVSFAGSDGTTQAVQTARLESLHARGYGGENVTVAVLDVGQFDLDNPALAGRVVAAKDLTGKGIDEAGTGGHGTATAELVAETAPNASLVLVRVNSRVQFYRAVDWIETETEADIVSMSLGWYNIGPLDGTSEFDRAINESVANGTTWVVSAGNSANGNHWGGTWSDPDGDGLMNFDGTREYLAVDVSDSARIWTQWDDWENRTEDYAVCLYTDSDVENSKPLTCSDSRQDGSNRPTEYLGGDLGSYGTLYLTIEESNADRSVRFDVFLNDRSTFRNGGTVEGSLTLGATSPNAVTVGAYDQANGELEPYSSRGPTIDGRTKPDVVAADNVRSSVYDSGFHGTSASAPHTAGVLATLLDANRRLTPAQLKANLTASARPVGDVPNNETGHGEVDASRAVAGLGAYDLPPDGRLSYDGRYRLDTGGSAVPDSLVVDAANVTVDGEGAAFDAGGDAVLATTANATNLSVRDLTVTGRSVGVAASDLRTLELTNVSTTADAALSLSNVSAVTLANVSPADAPSFDLSGENVSLSLDASNAPPDRGRLSAALNLTLDASNATVTLRYDESHANESTAAVWTNAGGNWTETNASVDADANAVTFEASASGTYGVYAVGSPAADAPTDLSLSSDVDAETTAAANVTNVGRADLTVVAANLSGPDADQFSLVDAPDNETVAPRATLGVRVRYAPNESGTHVATLSVRTAEVGTLNVTLDGTASVPEPEPTPTPTPDPSSGGSGGGGGGGGGAPATQSPTPTPTATPTPTPTPTPAPNATVTPTPGTRTPDAPVPHTTESESTTPRSSAETGTDAASETATPASTAADAEDADAETPAQVTGTGVPGFSPVTAAVALAAAAALLARRD